MRKLLIPGWVCRTASLVLALSVLGCSSAPRPDTAAGASPKTSTPSTPVPPPSPTFALPQLEEGLEPPDGKWLVDEGGKEYFGAEVPRVEGQYKWEEEGKRVRLAYGLSFDVLEYDDHRFVVKVYRPFVRVQRPAEPAPDLKALAAAYKTEVGSSDRLTFTPFSEGLPATNQWRHGFELVDINGDGQRDIVHGPARKTGSRPAIFLGDGKGHWKRWAEARFPSLPFDYGDATAGDLDGDGDVDVVLGNHLKGIVALVNDGKGTFSPWTQGIEFMDRAEPGAPAAFASREVEILDWNRDGRPDIVAIGEGPRMQASRGAGDTDFRAGSRGVVVYLNQGDGTWKKTGGAQSMESVFGDDIAFGDLNGDGITDFVTGSAVLGLRGLVNLGRADGTWETVNLDMVRPSAIFRGVGLGDFDGDGRLDFAIGYLSREGGAWRTGVDALLQRDGSWERRALGFEESQDGIYGLAVGDLDGDRVLDIVALTGGGKSYVLLGDGKGSFTREQGSELGEAGCAGYHVELADLDGDGAAEVVAGFAGEGGGLFGEETCPSGGSLRAWKTVPKGRTGK